MEKRSSIAAREKWSRHYICVEPSIGEWLYDFYNGALGKDHAERFAEHLFVCHRCQEDVASLDWIFAVLRTPKAIGTLQEGSGAEYLKAEFHGRFSGIVANHKPDDVFVVKQGDDWVVKRPNAEHASAVLRTQAEAIEHAKKLADRGEIHIQVRDGKFKPNK